MSSGSFNKDDCRPLKIEFHAGWSEAHQFPTKHTQPGVSVTLPRDVLFAREEAHRSSPEVYGQPTHVTASEYDSIRSRGELVNIAPLIDA